MLGVISSADETCLHNDQMNISVHTTQWGRVGVSALILGHLHITCNTSVFTTSVHHRVLYN